MEASEEVSSVVEDLSVAAGLPAVESAEGPGDLASHGERATTLATPATEKATTQVTQATERDTTQATQALERVTDTELHRKLLSFLCQSRANLQDSKDSVCIFDHYKNLHIQYACVFLKRKD